MNPWLAYDGQTYPWLDLILILIMSLWSCVARIMSRSFRAGCSGSGLRAYTVDLVADPSAKILEML